MPPGGHHAADLLLATSWLMLWLGSAPAPVLALTAMLFCGVGAFVLTRPDAAPLPAMGTRELVN